MIKISSKILCLLLVLAIICTTGCSKRTEVKKVENQIISDTKAVNDTSDKENENKDNDESKEKEEKPAEIELTEDEIKFRDDYVNGAINVAQMNDDEKLELYYKALEHLGSPNSMYRENMVLYIQKLISNETNPDMLKKIMDKCLSEDNLFYNIGSQDTDAVFRRTFTMLVMPSLLAKDNTVSYLQKEDFYHIKDVLVDYIYKEKDRRGFVEVKGWAHGLAHWSDIIGYYVSSSKLDDKDYIDLLYVIKDQIMSECTSFKDGEDERLWAGTSQIICRKITEEQLDEFLLSIQTDLKALKDTDKEKYEYVSKNVNQFFFEISDFILLGFGAKKEPYLEKFKSYLSDI